MALTVGIGGGGQSPPALPVLDPAAKDAAEGGVAPDGVVETTAALSTLAAHVGVVAEENANHRRASGVDERLERQMLMAEGRYSKEELAQIALTGARPLYAPIADKKRRAGSAMMSELFNNPGDLCWDLSFTPDPTVPKWVRDRAMEKVGGPAVAALAQELGRPPTRDEVARLVLERMEEIVGERNEFARKACRRMKERIADQMAEGGWTEEFNDYVEDLCTYGTGFMRGPEPRMRRTLEYVEPKSGGGGRVKVVEDVALSFECVSPWDVYPAPGARDVDDGPLVVRVRWLPEDLRLAATLTDANGGRKGWLPDAVDAILRASPQGGVRDWEAEARLAAADAEGEGRQDTSVATSGKSCMIEGWEFFGSVRGSELIGIGMDEDTDGSRVAPDRYYEIDAIRIGDVIVYCRIVEPEIGRPICKGVFFKQPDSFWGVGPMEKCGDMQRVANACLRDLSVNMAQSAGMQVVITDMSRLDPNCGTDLTPWKLWTFGPPPFGQGGNATPLQTFQPNSNAEQFLKVYSWADAECGNLCGIRDYTMGGGSAGEIGRTASGYSMLMESATRDFKHAVHQTDVGIVRKTVMMCYAWNMLHDRDESIKGDVRCVPAGMYGMIHKEQDYNRKMQFLQLVNNPTDMQIVGIPGRARLLREIARPMDLSLDGIVKSPEKLEEEQRMAEAMQRAQLLQQINAAQGAGATGEGGAPAPAQAEFRGTSAGRRATVPQPGTGITPQARGAMRATSQRPAARADQGMRAARTREANRAAAS